MSITHYVVGVIPADEDFHKMYQVYEACQRAKVPVPDEVLKFFNWEKPDLAGMIVDLDRSPAVKRWRDDYRQGYEIELDQLPPQVKFIRAIIS